MCDREVQELAGRVESLNEAVRKLRDRVLEIEKGEGNE